MPGVTFSIHKLTRMRARPDYRRYFVNPPEAEAWGLAVTGSGRQTCQAGSPYPPAGHPRDHQFSWEDGRVLGACQIVFISQGAGSFESRATGLVRFGAGTALVVLPGVWHRYAPDPASGWTEQWIELQGPTPDALVRNGLLEPTQAVLKMERALKVESLLDEIQARLSRTSSGFDPEAAALGLQVLSLVVEAPRLAAPSRPITSFVARAEQLLMDAVDRPPAIPGLARELGVAYSYFRREFKRHTGLAPYQYVRRLRMEKARRMIGSSSESLQAISERLGFASPFHLSAAFKKQFGLSPDHWRRRRG
jgi:AraC-like DNA-binding protein